MIPGQKSLDIFIIVQIVEVISMNHKINKDK